MGGSADGRARALTSNFIEAELLDTHPPNAFAAIRISSVDDSGHATARLALS